MPKIGPYPFHKQKYIDVGVSLKGGEKRHKTV